MALRPKRSLARRRPAARDGGFLLVEAIVAIGVLTIVVLATEWALIGAFSAATTGDQHDVASGLVQNAITECLALPFGDLQAGLDPAADPLSGDPNVTSSVVGGVTTYTLSLTGQTIATSGTATAEAPLVPHLGNLTRATTDYHVAVYPTTSSAAPGVVTVVVVVSWTASGGRAERVVGQSSVAAP